MGRPALISQSCIPINVDRSLIDLARNITTKGPSKIYGVPGPGLRTGGGLKVFWLSKRRGRNFFLTKETWGLVLFFIEKRRGPLSIILHQKGGQQLILLVKF